MIPENEKICVCIAMSKYGGSFVKGLSQALQSADAVNKEKIKATWPELWKEYYEIGKRLKQ